MFNITDDTSSIEVVHPFGFQKVGVGIGDLARHPFLQCVRASFEADLVVNDHKWFQWGNDWPNVAQSSITTLTIVTVPFLLIDRTWGVVVWPVTEQSGEYTSTIIDNIAGGDPLISTCIDVWKDLQEDNDRVLLYDARLELAEADRRTSFVTASKKFWDRVSGFSVQDVGGTYNSDSNQLNALVAELLQQDGQKAVFLSQNFKRLQPNQLQDLVAEFYLRKIPLTKSSEKAIGTDVLAFAETPVGYYLYLLTWAQSPPQDRPRISVVRSMYSAGDALGALILSVAPLDEDLHLQDCIEQGVTVESYDGLTEWLRRASEVKWPPRTTPYPGSGPGR